MRTQGPWTTETKRNGIDLYGREDGGCAFIAAIEPCCDEDAALISAAPLLLDLVERMMVYYCIEVESAASPFRDEARKLIAQVNGGSVQDPEPITPWTPCACCDNYICNIHGMHAHDCPCPPVDEWEARGESPYISGGKP